MESLVLVRYATSLAAQGREGRLVLRVDVLGPATTAAAAAAAAADGAAADATATTTTIVASEPTPSARTAAATGSATRVVASSAAASATATAATSSSGPLRLNVSIVDLEQLLSLALTLPLSFARCAGDELIIILLDKRLGRSPLLVGLGALIGLAHLQRVVGFESQLLLGQLGQVVGIRDTLVLRLSGSLLLSFTFRGSVFSDLFFLILLSNGFASLLVF